MRLPAILLQSFIFSLLLLTLVQTSNAQNRRDSISLDDLKEFAFDFSLENGQLQGPGAAILQAAISTSQYTMLGDNSGSKLEQNFTKALIQELDKHNYKNMVLEVGIGTAPILNKLATQKDHIPEELKKFNQQYALHKKDRVFIPLLEFRHIEGAEHFQTAARQDWNFLAIGVAPWTSYKMLTDALFANLTNKNQEIHRSLFEQVQTLINENYEKIQAHNSDEVKDLIAGLKSNASLQNFLDKMRLCAGNKELIEGLQYSLDYWEMYGNKEFYRKNMVGAKKDKLHLAQALKRNNFDLSKDKLFVKMWRNHLGKGHSIAGTYGVGNMLLELAEAHGNKSLTIGFIQRYSNKEGRIEDILDSQDGFSKRYQEFVQLGKKEDWVLVDLRSFNEKFYYGPYAMSDSVYKMFARYDMLVIPKADVSGTPNY